MGWGTKPTKGYTIVPINEGQFKFAVKDAAGNTMNRFLTERAAKSWIKTVG